MNYDYLDSLYIYRANFYAKHNKKTQFKNQHFLLLQYFHKSITQRVLLGYHQICNMPLQTGYGIEVAFVTELMDPRIAVKTKMKKKKKKKQTN